MKYIIVGLGNFGANLANLLTEQGNEVIGIDIRMDRVDMYKEKISHTISMDATDEFTVTGLPLKDTDVVIVAIGENKGANIMATALFKNLNVKRLISRAIDDLHEKVLQALGVDEIVHPEQETAKRWSKKLHMQNVVDSFELSNKYSIIEARVPEEYIGKTVEEAQLKHTYNLLLLTTIKHVDESNLFGKSKKRKKVQGVATAKMKLEKDDVMVVYGANDDLQKFLKLERNED